MEIEQIVKRLDWLDDERRKDKLVIASLEDRLAKEQGTLPGLMKRMEEVASELTRISQVLARFDQVDGAIASLKVELTRMVEAADKQRLERERELEKLRRADLDSVNKSISELRLGQEAISELRRALTIRVDEDFRLGRLIEEAQNKYNESNRANEDAQRTVRLMDEGRKQDAKRLTDMQAEVSAMRKRGDEQRGKIELLSDSMRKVELRVGELQAAEGERRQNQAGFMEKFNLWQTDRERTWKEMQTRFDEISRQAINLDAQLQSLDAVQRAVKRSQEAFDEVTQRIERRINEITEMQRLAEDRFRQEWTAYRADDQKRWTNYSLVQEEQQREMSRQNDKTNERLVTLEDVSQEVRDLVHQITEDNQKRLQTMLALYRDMSEEYDRAFGRTR
jgi:chromosome segregation ATPase